jgi:putative ABC transport system permease protein
MSGRLKTRLSLMSVSDVAVLYRARLGAKAVLVQEAFAIVGIAVGVALLFASQVASTSLTHSVDQLTHQIVGNAQYQLDARGPEGFDERLLVKARQIPGVLDAFPVLEQQASVIGGRGERSVDLIGVDPRFVHVSGPLLRRFSAAQLSEQHAIALPGPIAAATGAGSLEAVTVQTGAGSTRALVGAVLEEGDIGGLVHSPVAIAPVSYAQRLSGMQGMITRIFIRLRPGGDSAARRALSALAGQARANLQPANFDSTLFRVASTPENQGEALFSAISALVGFMFALNAMLVTVPSRRRLIEDLRPQGATRAMVIQILLFDATVLGTLACVLGVVFGELLSIAAFHATPGYLSSAFPIGNDRVVTWQAVVLAGGAGLIAAFVGVLWPLRDLLAGPLEREDPVTDTAGRAGAVQLVAGAGLLAVTTAILFAAPQRALLGSVTLVLALVCLLPFLFDLMVGLFDRLQERVLDDAATTLAVNELQNPRIRVRSLAVAVTGAVAVFGAVAVGGTQANLQHGLDVSASGIDAGADVWVAPRGESSELATAPFSGGGLGELERLPGVRAVGEYRGSFLDWGRRRLWVLAPPANTLQPIPPGEILSGNLAVATAKIRGGGWVVLSQVLASEHDLNVGERFQLPSPVSTSLRVAAISTNLGWPPGALIMNSNDYARAWDSSNPSAYEIQAQPGASTAMVASEARSVLASQPGLAVETFQQRQARHFALVRQGLSRLTQIKLLVLLAGALAVAGAMGSLLWQRRETIAFMKVDGYRRWVLWRWLVCESALMLATGCLIGAVFGVYGQVLNSYALANVTGLPIALGVEAVIAVTSFLLVSAIAVAIVAVPGYLVVRVPPSTVSPAY